MIRKGKYFIVLLLFSVLGCYRPSPQQTFEDLKILQGNWISSGHTIFNENWELVSDTLLTGTGFSLNGNDTAFAEQLKIFRQGDSIYYATRIGPQNGFVMFRLEKAGYHQWTFKNPGHGYPNIIRYEIEKDTLLNIQNANIRGNKKVLFVLKKITP